MLESRQQKIEFIRMVKKEGITDDDIFFITINLDKCTKDELMWIYKTVKDSGKNGFSPKVITEENRAAFEKFKSDYRARQNTQNTTGKNKVPQ